MTDQELKNNGWYPRLCKIGTLYFKGKFFCRLDGDKAVVYNCKDDMHSIGAAETFDEMKDIQRISELSDIRNAEDKLKHMKMEYEETYGCPPS